MSEHQILKSKIVSKSDSNYPKEVLHIFAENKPVQLHNSLLLNENCNYLYSIHAIDEIPPKCTYVRYPEGFEQKPK